MPTQPLFLSLNLPHNSSAHSSPAKARKGLLGMPKKVAAGSDSKEVTDMLFFLFPLQQQWISSFSPPCLHLTL